MDKVNWTQLSVNPAAIHLLEANPNNINWWWLSKNPAGFHLIEAHKKFDWYQLSSNPNIFEYDYDVMRESRTELFHELVQVQFHPRNIEKFEGWALDDF